MPTKAQEIDTYEDLSGAIIITPETYIPPPKLKAVMVIDHLLQTNSEWSSETLGTCSSTIASRGCALTSMCMVLRAHGTEVNPDELNNYLKQNSNQGYSGGCNIIWSQACNYDNSTLNFQTIQNSCDLSVIKAEIDGGNPVIAHVDGATTAGHFIVITGYESDGSEASHFKVNDPNNSTTNRSFENYSSTCNSLRLFNNTDYSMYTINGNITDASNNPLANVNLEFSHNTFDYSTTTDESGNYSYYMIGGWSGTVTPTLNGHTFSPTTRSYTSLNSNQTNQNYQASVDYNYMISNFRPFVKSIEIYKIKNGVKELKKWSGFVLADNYLIRQDKINDDDDVSYAFEVELRITFSKLMSEANFFSTTYSFPDYEELIHFETYSQLIIKTAFPYNNVGNSSYCSIKDYISITGEDLDGNSLIGGLLSEERSISITELSPVFYYENTETISIDNSTFTPHCVDVTNSETEELDVDYTDPLVNSEDPLSEAEFIGNDDWISTGTNGSEDWEYVEIENCVENISVAIKIEPENPNNGNWISFTAESPAIGAVHTWVVDGMYPWETRFLTTRQGLTPGTHQVCLTVHGQDAYTGNIVCGSTCRTVNVATAPIVNAKFSFLNGCKAVKLGTPTKILDESWIRENQTDLNITWRSQMNNDRQEQHFSGSGLHEDGIYEFDYSNYGHSWQMIHLSTNSGDGIIYGKLAYVVDCSKSVTTNNWGGALYNSDYPTDIYSGSFELANIDNISLLQNDSHLLSACSEIRLLPGFQYSATTDKELTLQAGNICESGNYLKSAEILITSINKDESIIIDKSLNIYPNPTTGEFNLEFKGDFADTKKVEIYSVTGSKLIETEQLNRINKFSLSGYSKGVYLLKIINSTGYKIEKIIYQ